MKKITSLLLLVFSLIFSININASELDSNSHHDAEIKGVVVDNETDGPLEYATISLFNSQDSTLVTGVITDMQGAFSLQTKPGKYYIVVQFMGYQSKTINVDVKNAREVVSLGKIIMYTDSALLDEIEVVAEKSTMTMALDKRVFNVG